MLFLLKIWHSCIFIPQHFALLWLLIFYFNAVHIHCSSIVCPFSDVCVVLFCSSLLHPFFSFFRWPACIWGLMCFQLCLSLPLQEWTLRSTFRSARKRNVRGLIVGTGLKKAEVWIRLTEDKLLGRIDSVLWILKKWVIQTGGITPAWMMRQDQRLLNILCPFHFFSQALITFRCWLSLGAVPWLLLPCLCLSFFFFLCVFL